MRASEILRTADHRPWRLPRMPWIMRQTWRELLFAHWPVSPETLRARIPAGLDLDTYDGQAWVGVVPFRMTNVRPRGLPTVPTAGAFPELNVRTYVVTQRKPGVLFISLDAGSALAVLAARTVFLLPYYTARFDVEREDDTIHYESRRLNSGSHPVELATRYRPVGPVFRPAPGSLEDWLTARYCLYTAGRSGRLYRAEIHHAPWPLQVAEAVFTRNTMASAQGIALPNVAPLLHYAERLDMVAWPILPV